MVVESARSGRQRELLDQYPGCADNIGRGLFYFDQRFLGELGHFRNTAIDFTSLRVIGCQRKANYWSPDKDMHLLMANTVKAKVLGVSKSPLRKPDDPSRLNPRFDDFGVKYPNELRAYLVDDTVRISHFDNAEIEVALSTYLDQLATNLAPELIFPDHGKSLRTLDTSKSGTPSPLRESILANTIGVAGIFVDKFGTPLIRYRNYAGSRSEVLAVMPMGWHVGTSGALKWQDLFIDGVDEVLTGEMLLQGLERGLLRELSEEAFKLQVAGRLSCRLYAFARELPRAGKPQFFFTIHFHDLSTEQIITEILNAQDISEPEYSTKGRIFRITNRQRTQDLIREVPSLRLTPIRRDEQAIEAIADDLTYECEAAHRLLHEAIDKYGFKWN